MLTTRIHPACAAVPCALLVLEHADKILGGCYNYFQLNGFLNSVSWQIGKGGRYVRAVLPLWLPHNAGRCIGCFQKFRDHGCWCG
jgi:hypothetical protein